MVNKVFSERLNKELDVIGAPSQNSERVHALAKLLKIQKFKAEALLNGNIMPDTGTLAMLTQEFEVNGDWLLGKSDQR